MKQKWAVVKDGQRTGKIWFSYHPDWHKGISFVGTFTPKLFKLMPSHYLCPIRTPNDTNLSDAEYNKLLNAPAQVIWLTS